MIKNYLEKLQSLPEEKKKIILWAIVIVIGLIMAIFWFKMTKERLEKINNEEITKPFDSLVGGLRSSEDGQKAAKDLESKLSEIKNLIEEQN